MVDNHNLKKKAADPKALTQRLVEALGIKRVINVDDDAVEVVGQSKEDVIGALRANEIDRVLVARLVLSDEENEDATDLTLDELISRVDERWDAIGGERRGKMTFAAKRAEDSHEGPVQDQSQAVAGNNAALLALPDLLDETTEFKSMGIAEWRKSGYQLLDDLLPTLLLVDRSFEREGQSPTAGDDIITGILDREDRKHVYVGLLTYTAADEGREREIANTIQARLNGARSIIVIAKKRLSEGGFPEALRMVLFGDELEAFRRHAIAGLTEANDAATTFLARVDRYALLASLEAARREGSYETDHALRMAGAPARKAITATMRADTFVEGVLAKLRDAASIALYFDGSRKPADLPQMIWDERFDAQDYLARWSLPLEIGDIFRVFDLPVTGQAQGGDRYYILLAQACDLSVRPNGKRSNDLDSLVLTELKPAVLRPDTRADDAVTVAPEGGDALVLPESNPAVGDLTTGRFKSLKENQAEIGYLFPDSDIPWRVQFASQIHVPALALDACVIHPEGRSIVNKHAGMPPKALSPAWAKHFSHMSAEAGRLITKFASMEEALSIVRGREAGANTAKRHVVAALLGTRPLHSAGVTARINTDTSSIEYGIERHARVADSTAKGLLAMLAHHHARPAFDGRLFYDPDEHA